MNMSRLTLRLPDSLHRQLEALARSEGISLNQYLVYALTRQVTLAYAVRAVPEEDVEEQRRAYAALLQSLGQASSEQVSQVLQERESIAPETGLSPDVVQRLRERISAREQTQ
jgi:FixJ family two-component response regulator